MSGRPPKRGMAPAPDGREKVYCHTCGRIISESTYIALSSLKYAFGFVVFAEVLLNFYNLIRSKYYFYITSILDPIFILGSIDTPSFLFM